MEIEGTSLEIEGLGIKLCELILLARSPLILVGANSL